MLNSQTYQDIQPVRLRFLDGLRALAALWVVLGHAHLLSLGWNRSGTLWGRPLDVLLYCHLGVDVFLVLSGFCLALGAVGNGKRLSGGMGRFFWNRAWRILPPYYAALSIILLVNSLIPLAAWGYHPIGKTGTLSWQIIWSNLLLVQDLFPTLNVINGPFWSVAAELHLYLTFPLLLWMLRRWGALAMMAAAGGAAILLTWMPFERPQALVGLPLTLPQPTYFIALFAMGALAAALAFDPRYAGLRLRWQRLAWLATALMCVPLCALLWHFRIVSADNLGGFMGHLHWIDPLAGAASALALLWLCGVAPTHWLRRRLEGRALVAIGGFSYSLYLIHVPVLATLKGFVTVYLRRGPGPMETFWLLALGGTALSLLAAKVFAWAFERRYRRRAAAGTVRAALAKAA